MSHNYDIFTAPPRTSQGDPEAEQEEATRRKFAREIATMLDSEGQDYAASLVRGFPVDGEWP
ncbi:hypothetical protein GTW20_00435 [Nocardiopsis alba]|uniref:Uncharacterized protein n=1 Tax=Nocardiopsis alba TaxID=53437 RepID=A0A7K2IL48_9ACTN|nr:hypothetical protein [Nocardiopsis alba]MYR30698.1 hypothetical protein [Nocardiopsis alba]MYR30768.1 hypothetical protein [Nocardiopsis alba]